MAVPYVDKRHPDYCYEWVFTGDRVDTGGHQCNRKHKVEHEGRRYCKAHHPDAAAKRRQKTKERWDIDWATKKARWELESASIKAFETAAKKMRKECPNCVDGIPTEERPWFRKSCPACFGIGTIGPSPLALAEALSEGGIAELIAALEMLVYFPPRPDEATKMGHRILAKLPEDYRK